MSLMHIFPRSNKMFQIFFCTKAKGFSEEKAFCFFFNVFSILSNDTFTHQLEIKNFSSGPKYMAKLIQPEKTHLT